MNFPLRFDFQVDPSPSVTTQRDDESVVLMRLRQAEERKRLIEQMQNEDEENGPV